MDYNFDTAQERYVKIANALGAEVNDEMSYEEQKQMCLAAARSLKEATGATGGLAELGVTREDLRKLAGHALKDPCMLTNPKCPQCVDIEEIYEKAR